MKRPQIRRPSRSDAASINVKHTLPAARDELSRLDVCACDGV